MDQPDLLRRAIEVFEAMDIRYMVVGSIASGAYGEPRMTQDIDIVADILPEDIPALCAAFPENEYYVSREAAEEAVRARGQFNIIHPSSGNKIDVIMYKEDAWGREQMLRRQRVRILPDLEASLARPEDIILSKMDYYREGGSEKHLRDITGILKVSGGEVDREYVSRWSARLGLSEIWERILRRLGEQ